MTPELEFAAHTARRGALTACAFVAFGASAKAQRVDSTSALAAADTPQVVKHKRSPWVTRQDAFLFAGAIGATAAFAPLDHPVENEFNEPDLKNSRLLHHVAGDFAFLGGDGPFVASALLFAAGTVGNGSTLQRFALHNMEAIALATALAGIGKGVTGRALPGVRTKHAFEFGRGFHDANGPFVSFPSGHTAAAFAMAATVSGEAQLIDSTHAALISRIAFGAAGVVGIARVAQRVHWASDLPLAVVIGTWSGRTVQTHGKDPGKIGAILNGLTVAPGTDRRTRLGWTSASGVLPHGECATASEC